METTLRSLKGVGEKTQQLFQKLGIHTIEDLLTYYPANYDAYEAPVTIGSLSDGEAASVLGTVVSGVSITPARNLQVVTATIADDTGKITAVWYRATYLRSVLKRGATYVFRGKAVEKKGRLQLETPEVFTPAAYGEIEHSLQPIYGLTKGLPNKTVVRLMHQALEQAAPQEDFLPQELITRYNLPDRNSALLETHFPRDRQQLLQARRRLVFDEFFLFILAVQRLKKKAESAVNAFPMKAVWTTETVIGGLPYRLTDAQRNAWGEIERDLTGDSLMSRLVQGDVGSGKTILAFLAILLTVQNGYQAALMVPTEVLANQHFEAFEKLLREQQVTGCHPVLLTGSLTAVKKRKIYEQIRTGEANVIIGTHALIQEKVEYRSLALAITDEQHRFGVKQRESLATRGNPPHVLVMSATPIPRTLAIILYGDLDISVIDELPAIRKPIKNCVVGISYRQKAYAFIQRQIQEGRQAYIICPMVEESEGMDGENVLDYTKTLQEIFSPQIRVAALHGKMKPKEKNNIMEAFARGEIQILVSTTVVEVGVNVPNATVMMVENAERFGLAQLHQLRGRVGRGEHQSYCIFMQGNEDKKISKRLEILNKSNDGFFIAGEDLKLRGPGDLFGIRQSGDMEFKIGDIYNDAKILGEASEAAAYVLSEDPDLARSCHLPLKRHLEDYRVEPLEIL